MGFTNNGIYIYGTDPISSNNITTTESNFTELFYNSKESENLNMRPISSYEKSEQSLYSGGPYMSEEVEKLEELVESYEKYKYPLTPKQLFKKQEMKTLRKLFTTVVYSKEELFFLIKIAEKAGINVEGIDPHIFPIAEVLLGEKIVYIPYNVFEKCLELHIIPVNPAESTNQEETIYEVVSLPEFMTTLGIESPREHILANFVNRRSKSNYETTVSINGVKYSRSVVEQLLDGNFDDFIANLEYESRMTYKND